VYFACESCFHAKFTILEEEAEAIRREWCDGEIREEKKLNCYFNRDPGVDIKSANKII
jgi:hypothetical protein